MHFLAQSFPHLIPSNNPTTFPLIQANHKIKKRKYHTQERYQLNGSHRLRKLNSSKYLNSKISGQIDDIKATNLEQF